MTDYYSLQQPLCLSTTKSAPLEQPLWTCWLLSNPFYASTWGSWRCFVWHVARECVCAYTPQVQQTLPSGTPWSGRLLSNVHTHRSYADRSLYALAQSLWRCTERPWPAPELCPGHLEYIRAGGGYWIPLPWPGWMGGPAQRSPFQQPSMIDRRPHSLTPAAATTHCDQNTHATTSTTSKTVTRWRLRRSAWAGKL